MHGYKIELNHLTIFQICFLQRTRNTFIAKCAVLLVFCHHSNDMQMSMNCFSVIPHLSTFFFHLCFNNFKTVLYTVSHLYFHFPTVSVYWNWPPAILISSGLLLRIIIIINIMKFQIIHMYKSLQVTCRRVFT